MGNVDSTTNQVLLLGLSGHGKTWFLHHNSLKTANYDQSQIQPSLGFNYEVLTHGETKIGVWDLAGGPIYKPMWKKFFKNLDIHGIVFMIRLYDEKTLLATEQKKKNEKIIRENSDDELPDDEVPDEAEDKIKVSPSLVAVEARKELHYVMNEYLLRDKFCFVIINDNPEFWPKDEGITTDLSGTGADKLKRIADCKELIKFDELPQKRKEIFVLDNIKNEFEECVEKLADFFKTAS